MYWCFAALREEAPDTALLSCSPTFRRHGRARSHCLERGTRQDRGRKLISRISTRENDEDEETAEVAPSC